MVFRKAVFLAAAVLLSFASLPGHAGEVPSPIRSQPGLIVFVGGLEQSDQILKALDPDIRRVVHWLDADPEAVRAARERLQEQGLYGTVTVEAWRDTRLPYGENLVNAVMVRDPGMGIDNDEVLRVLAPGGMAFVAGNGGGRRLEKARPPEMGEWTQPHRAQISTPYADGNPLSPDTAFGPPNGFQWIAGPAFPFGGRKSSASTILSAGGRLFTITNNSAEALDAEDGHYLDDPSPSPAWLEARDAFNGLPLWAIPWSGPEVIVAAADRLYAQGGEDDVRVLDSASGEELARWAIGANPTKLLLSGDSLVAQCDSALVAIDIADGSEQWRKEADNPYGALAADGQVYCLEGSRQQDGRWEHQLVNRALATGETLWVAPVESEYGQRAPVLRIQFVGAGVVCLLEQTSVRFLAAEDGAELWRHEGERHARRGDTRGIGHFLRGDEVWVRHTASDWLVCDPRTGEVLRERKSMASGRKKCQPSMVTERFVMNPRTSGFWDLEDGTSHSAHFTRGGCLTGIIPANGLGYTDPNACGCIRFSGQARGYAAITTNPQPATEASQPGEIEKGPAYGRDFGARPAADSWPLYRGNAERGAWTSAALPAQPRVRWQRALDIAPTDVDDEWRLVFGHPLTAPTAGGGLVTVARPQTHQVIALDKASGDVRWSYTADGRVTTPPTHHEGLVLFGAHDGKVYALDSRDGDLVWRRRAAPSDRRIMVHGQLESPWPVAGGVLVRDGIAVAAAGRSPFGEGGILVHAFDPRTGDTLWSRLVDNARYGAPDLLVAQGEGVYLMDRELNLRTGELESLRFGYGIRHQSERGGSQLTFPEGVRYLRSGIAGFSENAWTRVPFALRKGLSTWTLGAIEGELLSFGDRRATAFQIANDNFWGTPQTQGGGIVAAWTADDSEPLWRFDIEAPAQVESLLTNDDFAFISGPNARTQPLGNAFLVVLSGSDGSLVSEVELPTAPVHDGLAAADGKLFAVLRNGVIVCYVE